VLKRDSICASRRQATACRLEDVEAGGIIALCDSDGMTRCMRRLTLGEDPAVMPRQLLREETKESGRRSAEPIIGHYTSFAPERPLRPARAECANHDTGERHYSEERQQG
jgi:hypothetical protein